MIYKNVLSAEFICRTNRFVALVNLNGNEESVHVKNTGRLSELLTFGSKVYLCESENPKRKTRYDLIGVYKEGLGVINIDSLSPNKAVKEWLIKEGFDNIICEYTYGKSRLDFYFEDGEKKFLAEVKGCTLQSKMVGLFPDSPTKRGTKHINELIRAKSEGYESVLIFAIQIPGVERVVPNISTDKEFYKAYQNAKASGVKVMCMSCFVSENEIKIIHRKFV